jgi:chromosome segregation ATPase
MELVIIVLCSMSGALVGTALGILLMFRRIRQPSIEAELAKVKGKLQSVEASLAARTADLENLRKQLVERDLVIQRSEEAVREIQQHLDLAVAERAAAEQNAREFSVQVESLTAQQTQLETQVKEAKDLARQMVNEQVTSYEAELDGERRQVRELTDQVTRLAAEAAQIRSSGEQEKLDRSALETELAAERERTRQLTDQVARLTAEIKTSGEQEKANRSALDAELGAERERTRQLTAEVQGLQNERSQFGLRLQEERQSAAKGMELLLMAQQNLARVFKSSGVDAPGGANGHAALEAAQAVAATRGEATEELQPVLARD